MCDKYEAHFCDECLKMTAHRVVKKGWYVVQVCIVCHPEAPNWGIELLEHGEIREEEE